MASGQKRKRTSQWAFILPDNGGGGDAAGVDIITLQHPVSGKPARYMMSESEPIQLMEISKFEDKVSRSWFIGDQVQQDGSLHLATPVDPLFIALPLLTKSSTQSFQPLDQILADGALADYAELERVAGLGEAMKSVCDVREAGDDFFYRYSPTKLTAYLRSKVEHIAAVLEKKPHIAVGAVSASAVFARSKKSTSTPYSRKQYAVGMLSEYVAPEIVATLIRDLGMEASPANAATSNAGAKATPPKAIKSTAPTEDYMVVNPTAKKTSKAPTSRPPRSWQRWTRKA